MIQSHWINLNWVWQFTLPSICGEAGAFDNFDEDEDNDFDCEFSVAEILFDWKFISCDCCWMCEIIVLVEYDNCVQSSQTRKKR